MLDDRKYLVRWIKLASKWSPSLKVRKLYPAVFSFRSKFGCLYKHFGWTKLWTLFGKLNQLPYTSESSSSGSTMNQKKNTSYKMFIIKWSSRSNPPQNTGWELSCKMPGEIHRDTGYTVHKHQIHLESC